MKCEKCENLIEDNSSSCVKCEFVLNENIIINNSKINRKIINQIYLENFIIIGFFIISILLFKILIRYFLNYYPIHIYYAIIYCTYSIVLCYYVSKYFNQLKELLNFKLNYLNFTLTFIVPIISAIYVFSLIDVLQIHFGINVSNATFEFNYLESNKIYYCILFICVLPSIFEELIFRFLVFNNLLKIMNINKTIIFSALLFWIIHFNFLSVLWLFPGGIMLGYLRYRNSSIFFPIIFHFLYNLTGVLLEIFFH